MKAPPASPLPTDKPDLVPVQIAASAGRGWIKKLLFLAAVTAFWCGITGVFVGIVIHTFLKTAVAGKDFATAQGKVLNSEVKTSHGSKSNTYSALVRYTYTVDGKVYTSDRYSYDSWGSSDAAHANQVVAANRPGKAVTVYYSASDPSDAVLTIKPEPVTYIMLLAMQPFALVGLGLLGSLLALPVARGRIRRFLLMRQNRPPMDIPTWGRLEISGQTAWVQGRRRFLAAFAMGYGAAIFVAIFPVVFFYGEKNVRPEHVYLATAIAGGIGLLAALLAVSKARSRVTLDGATRIVSVVSRKRNLSFRIDDVQSWVIRPAQGGRFRDMSGGTTTLVPALLTAKLASDEEMPVHVFGGTIPYMAGEELASIAAKTAEVFSALTGKPWAVLEAEPDSAGPAKPALRGRRGFSVGSAGEYADLM